MAGATPAKVGANPAPRARKPLIQAASKPPAAAHVPIQAAHPLAAPVRPSPGPAAPIGSGRRTEQHDGWVQTFAGHLRHDASALFASTAQAAQQGGHNALAGAETALLDMKSGVTKFGGHVLHKDVSGSLAADDKHRQSIAAGADTHSFAFKAGQIGTHVVVDTAATLAVAAGGEFVLGAAGLGAAATTAAGAVGMGEVAAGVAGRLAVGAVANAAGSSVVTAAQGGNVREVLKSAAVGGLSVGVGHAVGEVVNPLAKAAAGQVAQAAPKLAGVSGRAMRVGAEVVSGGATGAGVSALTGDKPQDVLQNALFGGVLSGAGAVIHARGAPKPLPGEQVPVPHHPATTPDAAGHPPVAATHEGGAPVSGSEGSSNAVTRPHAPSSQDVPAHGTAPLGATSETHGTQRSEHGTPVAGDGAGGDHIALQEGGAGSKDGPVLWSQRLNELGPAEVKALAHSRANLTPELRRQLGSEPAIDTLLDGERNRDIVPGVPNYNKGALPDQYHDSHAHEGPYSGTFDPTYLDSDMGRLTQLSQDGKRMTLNFPVAPHIFELGDAKIPGNKLDPAYYLRRRQGASGPENVMGTAKLINGEVHIMDAGVTDTTGQPRIKPGKYSLKDFEALIGQPFPPGLEEIHFVSSPAHTTLSYQGPKVDEKHIKMIAEYAAQGRQFLDDIPQNVKGLHVGLAGSNVFDPSSYKGAYDSLNVANEQESLHGLPKGTVKISGYGELTIAKEAVGGLSRFPPLNEKTVRDISQAISPMRYAGGTTVIHMDASNSKMVPDLSAPGSPSITTLETHGQAENLKSLEQLLRENPDQEIIWAHIGAAVTQTVPNGYGEKVRELLAKYPNLKIDTSWTATADMIAGRAFHEPANKPPDAKNVSRWAEIIADNPDRFMWGSDTIAASQKGNEDVVATIYKRFKDIGLLDEIKRIGDAKGNSDAIEKFLTENFKDSIAEAAKRVTRFRTDELNAAWLKAGGPSDANGRVPPMQYVKTNGEWEFVKSDTLENGGNRETYIMPDDAAPAQGETMIWKADGSGYYEPTEGPARKTGEFPLNPNRNKGRTN